jgi:taurine dioxygenase
MRNSQISVQPIAGCLGAEVSGVDMARDIDAKTVAAVQDALLEHQVIFLRDQDLTPEQHVAFAAQFGSLQVHPYVPHLDDHPEVLVLKSDAANRQAANAWHSDVTFAEEPPLGSILLAREVPDHGGDTMWSDMYSAYDSLSPSMKRYLDGMTALHSPVGAAFEKAHDDTVDAAQKAEIKRTRMTMAEVEHPVVRTHPVTGRRALFVNSIFTRRLKGVPRKESALILGHLFEHLTQPEFTCRFHWTEGSVACWDNRCTQPYAIADYGDATRVMHRVTINGDRPY